MSHLKTLTAMQLRDKIDLSWLKSKKKLLRKTIISISKFVLFTAIIFILLYVCNTVQIFSFDEAPTIVILVLTISLALSLVGCTIELMHNLYFSEDNKVLITLPVNSNQIFVSKIAVYYIYELKRSFGFLVPIALGCNILLVVRGLCSPLIFLWMWIPLIFIVALPVLLGALLSIPAMYIYRLIKKNSIIELITFIIILGLIIWGTITLINLIPSDINLIQQWPTIRRTIRETLIATEKNLFIMSELVYIIIGKKQSNLSYAYSWSTFLSFGIVILVCALLVLLVYLISRPLFFSMMAKNFENNKSTINRGKNKKHKKYGTFVNKEFIINLRTINISVNYLMIYIIVPILVLLLNKIYSSMELSSLGERLVFIFNMLLILLALLTSNALVATYYSREGRAGYIKKTKPIEIVYPLLAKLVFNVAFSIPTIISAVFIFGKFNAFGALPIVLIICSILFIHIGHMIYSATLDIMNPQNEQYATLGVTVDNPNENKSTLMAFVLSFVFALVAYMFYTEGVTNQMVTAGFLKLAMVALVYLGGCILMFLKRVKAFYYDMQGN